MRGAEFADLRGGDALVVSVVPFADVFCDLDFCFCADGGFGEVGFFKGEAVAAAEFEEGEGVLRAVAGGDVSEGGLVGFSRQGFI